MNAKIKVAISFMYKFKGFIVTVIAIFFIYLYVISKHKEINENGVIVLVRVDYYEGASDGAYLHLSVFYNGEIVHTSIDSKCRNCEGKYFFGKIESGKPDGYLVLYKDVQVPQCILTETLPPQGWKEIPHCQ